MDGPGTNRTVDERTAAWLLGLSVPDLRWYSRLLGLGRWEEIGNVERVVFSLEELNRLSAVAFASSK